MHLRSLTLKGFKSFAQATTFAFEPGVTCIVGPNGSGKSNVVDALAWVMGEQGVKNLRGGSMADVIFAGTATRGPLGRAEVVLTIDNADGALPIEYGEVAISRLLFRDGRSEYAINGDGCRLLDVQELLSDSGLGREMHVIVGQGRLDAVLRASPAERRGFVEEAAGILKHRRRKERTVRKLEAMQANLTRLTDLADELHRQLKPLGAQARTAREAAGIQADVRQARTRLLAHDAGLLVERTGAVAAERAAVAADRLLAEDEERGLEQRAALLEAAADGDELDALRGTALALRTAQERLRSLAQTASTRVALLAPDPAPQQATGPGADEREAAARAVATAEQRAAAAAPLAEAAARALQDAQRELAQVDEGVARQVALVAEHERRIARAGAQVAAAEGRAAAADADLQRRSAARTGAAQRAEQAQALLDAARPLEAADPGADLAALRTAADAAATAVDAAREDLHALEREASGTRARLMALQAATAVPPSAAEVLRALPGAERLQDVIEVDEPWRVAITAVLGASADAAVLPPGAALIDAAPAVAGLGAAEVVSSDGPDVLLPQGGVAAISVVRGPAGVLGLLADVVLVEDLPAALVAATGRTIAVTRAGETVSAVRLRTAGAAAAGPALAGERDAAAARAAGLDGRVAAARSTLAAAQEQQRLRGAELAIATTAARDSERAARVAEREHAGLAARAEAAGSEQDRAAAQVLDAEAATLQAAALVATARDVLALARQQEPPAVDRSARAPAASAVEEAREGVLTARLEQETRRARLRAERDRLAGLERRAATAERLAEEAARREAQRAVQREAAEQVAAELPAWLAAVDADVAAAGVAVAAAERRRAEHGGELRDARARLAAARSTASDLDRRARDLDMRAYELDVSLGALRDRAATELGLDDAALAAEHLPDLDRDEEQRALAAAERRLARLGRVNPLALEEFSALEARHAFLAEQLADLTRTRADLLTIVADLDARMAETFDAAYADTEAAFARIFPVLFPGGAGRLLRVAGDDGDGIDVTVRPAGKKIERLSLLSGGERSLAAVAFLLAIFTARPSPFYILDEVEAALDDANLGRLLEVVSSLRDASQLILITHQKRTMEIADALYGVSMQQDGVSSVIGQRMADRA